MSWTEPGDLCVTLQQMFPLLKTLLLRLQLKTEQPSGVCLKALREKDGIPDTWGGARSRYSSVRLVSASSFLVDHTEYLKLHRCIYMNTTEFQQSLQQKLNDQTM